MSPNRRTRFILSVTVGYALLAALWIIFSDQLLAQFADPVQLTRFSIAKGLLFVALTTALLFLALLTVPAVGDALPPAEVKIRSGPYQLLLATLIVLLAFAVQWMVWRTINPYAWFLFFPAVFVSSWLCGLRGGLLATLLSVALVWYFFIPPYFSFALDRPLQLLLIGGYMAMGLMFSLMHERLRQAEKAAADARFRGLVEQQLVGMYIIEGGYLRYVNPGFAQIFGYESAAELVDGTPIINLVAPQDRARVLENIRKRIEGEVADVRYGFVGLRRDGKAIHVEVHGRAFDYQGKPAVIGVIIDVSEAKQVETALRVSEAKFRSYLNNAPVAIFVTDDDGCYQEFNPAAIALLGYDAEELSKMHILDVVQEEDAERVVRDFTQLKQTGFVSSEYQLKRRDGGLVWVSLSAAYAGDNHAIGFCLDITERKQMEAALAASEALARLILETSPGAMLVADAEGVIVLANHSAEVMFGYGQGELLGVEVERLAPLRYSDVHRIFRRRYAEQPRTRPMGSGLDIYGWRKNGDEFPVEIGLGHFREGERFFVIANIYDISARKLAEMRLRESERMLEHAQTMARLGSWAVDLTDQTFRGTAEAYRIVGWQPSTRSWGDLMQLVHPDDQARVQSAWRQAQLQGSYDIEHRVLINGQTKWLHVMAEFSYAADGKQLQATGMTQDISETREAQNALEAHRANLEEQVAVRTAELRQQSRYMKTLLDGFPFPVWLKDTHSFYLTANRALAAACGRSLESVVQHTDLDLWPVTQAERIREDDVQVMTQFPQRLQEERQSGPQGDTWIETYKARVLDDDGSVLGTVGFARDISERKAMEAAQEAARLEAERLAQARNDFLANMSHEIRTPLNAVLSLAQLGWREHGGSKEGATFGRIVESGQHLLGVINDILDFSKIDAGKLTLELGRVVLAEVIDRAVAFTAPRAYGKGLLFQLNEAEDLPAQCQGDALRLAQILVNLLANAIKFTEKGVVSLSVSRHDDSLLLAVRDTGIGLGPEQLQRLFHPFEQADSTTTRRFGGTGLGLSITQSLVQAMGGAISASSEEGAGSCFDVRLPLQAASGCYLPAPGSAMMGPIYAQGLAATEPAILQAHVVDVRVLPAMAEAPAGPSHWFADAAWLAQLDLTVLDAAIARGVRIVAVATPGGSDLPSALRERMSVVERPLRWRHCLAALAAPSVVPLVRPKARLAGLRILAAEDNATNQLVLEELLGKEGAQLRCVSNGQQLLDAVQASGAAAWDVVLTDIQMPVMDGYEAARRLRQWAPVLPVIGLTAHAMTEERNRCFAAGMVEHVTKPIDFDQLVQAILRHGRHPSAEDLAAAEPPVAAELDWPGLMARFGGRQEFVARLLTSVLENYAALPAQLQETDWRERLPELAFIAHSIKGMAGNLSAHALRDVASETEKMAREGQAEAGALALRLALSMQHLLQVLAGRAAELQQALSPERST